MGMRVRGMDRTRPPLRLMLAVRGRSPQVLATEVGGGRIWFAESASKTTIAPAILEIDQVARSGDFITDTTQTAPA